MHEQPTSTKPSLPEYYERRILTLIVAAGEDWFTAFLADL